MKPFGFQPTRPLRGATDDLLADAVPNEISTHAPLAGRDKLRFKTNTETEHFNPRAPCGARLRGDAERTEGQDISTHAPLAGRDGVEPVDGKLKALFQPTRPLRGATVLPGGDSPMAIFQPTRPLRGATGWWQVFVGLATGFQPTRPLRGATGRRDLLGRHRLYFNPRAPCGARQGETGGGLELMRFQPTRPLRGATASAVATALITGNFNPRAPCGARRAGALAAATDRAGFQPTRPLRGATGLSPMKD